MGGPVGALLLLAGSLSLLAASFVVCYTIWSFTWEGWESWNARTGLDEERALEDEERRRHGG